MKDESLTVQPRDVPASSCSGGCRAEGDRICGECQGAFVCRIQAGYSTCWCFELPPVLSVDADAQCVCPECLRRKIAERLK